MLFRDTEGNVYEIPQEDLAQYRVKRVLPVGTQLQGEQLHQVLGGNSQLDGDGPGYAGDGPGYN